MRIRFQTPILAVAALLALALAPAAGAAAKLSAPVIHESFTVLPCGGSPNNRTTIEQEGCAEHQVIKSDRTIDSLNAKIFATLHTTSAQQHFITAHNAWLNYRHAYCVSFADIFQGGTQGPVLYAQCLQTLNLAHIGDLKTFYKDLTAG